jgi:hypothetical protein
MADLEVEPAVLVHDDDVPRPGHNVIKLFMAVIYESSK